MSPEELANMLGITVVRHEWVPIELDCGADIGYFPDPPTMHVSLKDHEFASILHDCAHYLVASYAERQTKHWGFDEFSDELSDITEQKTCLVNLGLAYLIGDADDVAAVRRDLSLDWDCTPPPLLLRWQAQALLRANGIDVELEK